MKAFSSNPLVSAQSEEQNMDYASQYYNYYNIKTNLINT